MLDDPQPRGSSGLMMVSEKVRVRKRTGIGACRLWSSTCSSINRINASMMFSILLARRPRTSRDKTSWMVGGMADPRKG